MSRRGIFMRPPYLATANSQALRHPFTPHPLSSSLFSLLSLGVLASWHLGGLAPFRLSFGLFPLKITFPACRNAFPTLWNVVPEGWNAAPRRRNASPTCWIDVPSHWIAWPEGWNGVPEGWNAAPRRRNASPTCWIDVPSHWIAWPEVGNVVPMDWKGPNHGWREKKECGKFVFIGVSSVADNGLSW